MKVVTSNEMREIDRVTIEGIGIPSSVLMERAGISVVKNIVSLLPPKKVLILSGSGNNGGDGLVIARELFNIGYEVKVVILSEINKLSNDCRLQYEIAKRIGTNISFKKSVRESELQDSLIVDAILGTGLSKPVKNGLAKVINIVNRKDRNVLAVDIPSGISSDTGEIMGTAIRAKRTVTFGLPKRGHILFPGKDFTGELIVENIGFPKKLLKSEKINVQLVEKEEMAPLLPARPVNSHKGDYGHLLVIGGARGKTGAALMASRAALKTGSGLVTIGVPESMIDIFQSKVMEEMTEPIKDAGNGTFSGNAVKDILDFVHKKADVIAIGPGMGVSSNTVKIISELISNSPVPLIIDADGLNSLALLEYKEMVKRLNSSKSPVILTPHPGEMKRLLSYGRQPKRLSAKTRIEKTENRRQRAHNWIEIAQSFSRETSVYTVLKGSPTITAAPEGMVFINSSGNPGMATAGSGDVLTGIISSLVGQGLSPFHASVLGVYIHGLSGDITAQKKGLHSIVATDLIEYLPDSIRLLS